MKRLTTALAVMLVAFGCFAAFLPEVGNGTEPNKWTRNMAGVLAAAKTTGYPIFLTMINEAANGDGCSHCQAFVQNTINTAAWKSLVSDYKFYMVLMNRWGRNAGEVLDPAHGGVDSSTFSFYFNKYAASSVYPLVAVIRPDGVRYKAWVDPQTRGTNMPGHIREAIEALISTDSIFSLEAVSPVSVSEGGNWTGKIVRTGKSGKTGTVALALTGTHADRYTVTPASISWDGADGEKTVVVSGPSTKDGILSDSIALEITASGFSGSTISYGKKNLTLSFKDASIGKTLAEFSSSSGISTLSSGNIWYVPAKADGNVLETSTSGTALLTWTAAEGGVLSIAGNVSESVSMNATLTPVSGDPEDFALTTSAQTVGVAPGDKLVIKVSVSGEVQNVGFTTFSFSKLTVKVESPEDGEAFPSATLKTTPSIADLKWSGSPSGLTYEIFASTNGAANFTGTPVYSGTDASFSLIDAGFLAADTFVGSCQWGVRATRAAEHGLAAASATAEFSVTSGPAYPDTMPTSVSLFLKGTASLNYAAKVAEDAAKVTYSITGGKLPSGLTLNKKTGMISGTPTRAGTYSATVTAKSDEGTQSIELSFTVAKFPSDLKADYSGILFDRNQRMVGSATWKVAKSGKWTGSIVRAGAKTKLKGYVTIDENSTVILKDDNISISLVPGSKSVWGGTWNGLQLYGKKTVSSSTWIGNWNVGVSASANSAMAGYATAKVDRKGTAKVTTKILNKYKVSAKNTIVALDKAFIAEYLDKWANGYDAAFVQLYKKSAGRTFTGGFAFYVNGSATDAGAMFEYAGTFYDMGAGSRWTKRSLESLDGATVSTIGGAADITFTVKAAAAKLSAARNPYAAKIGGKASTGLFKGSYRAEGKNHKYEGILFVKDGALVGFGGGNAGLSLPFAIEIGAIK